MSKTTSIAPEQLKLSELVIDHSLSGRSEKEIKENAKLLAPIMEAAGKWDRYQPGQYYIGDDKKPHLLAGFTRVAAAQSLGWKHGWFFLDESDDLTRRFKCITTNEGKPVSRYHQGEVFAGLVAGIVADDFAGAAADPKNEKDWKLAPMTVQEIADKIGKSKPHVYDCINIFEAPEFAREMAETDLISPAIILTAGKWAKDDEKKMEKILRAAIREADGQKATQKHMDAIKPQFVTQKAVTSEGPVVSEPEKSDTHSPKDEAKRDASEDAEEESGDDEPESELKLEAPTAPKAPSKKATKTVRACVMTVITEFAEDFDDAQVEALTDKLIDAGLIVSELPF